MLQTALELAEEWANYGDESGRKLDVGVINARFVKPFDSDVILQPLREGKPLVAVEENMLSGGFGSAALEAANDEGLNTRALVRAGVPDRYIDHATREEQLSEVGLDRDGLAAAFRKALERARR